MFCPPPSFSARFNSNTSDAVNFDRWVAIRDMYILKAFGVPADGHYIPHFSFSAFSSYLISHETKTQTMVALITVVSLLFAASQGECYSPVCQMSLRLIFFF